MKSMDGSVTSLLNTIEVTDRRMEQIEECFRFHNNVQVRGCCRSRRRNHVGKTAATRVVASFCLDISGEAMYK